MLQIKHTILVVIICTYVWAFCINTLYTSCRFWYIQLCHMENWLAIMVIWLRQGLWEEFKNVTWEGDDDPLFIPLYLESSYLEISHLLCYVDILWDCFKLGFYKINFVRRSFTGFTEACFLQFHSLTCRDIFNYIFDHVTRGKPCKVWCCRYTGRSVFNLGGVRVLTPSGLGMHFLLFSSVEFILMLLIFICYNWQSDNCEI